MFTRFGHRSFLILLMVGLTAYFLSLVSDNNWRSIEPARYTEIAMVVNPDCDPVKQTCYATTDGIRLGLHFTGELKPLKRFQLQVKTAEGSAIALEGIDLQFSMRGMYMGEQHYVLRRVNKTEWQGDMVLPVCTRGRSDWAVELLARSGDRVYRAEFPFQLLN